MARTRTLFYGWRDAQRGEFRISRYPPDAPVRPSVGVATKAEVLAMVERRRADVYWWPPLPNDCA